MRSLPTRVDIALVIPDKLYTIKILISYLHFAVLIVTVHTDRLVPKSIYFEHFLTKILAQPRLGLNKVKYVKTDINLNLYKHKS